MTAPTIESFANAELEGGVLDELRRTPSKPQTLRKVAEAVRRRHAPASPILDVQAAVAATLDDLAHSGRVVRRRIPGGNVPAYMATCADDSVERRILALCGRLGGRRVEIAGGNPADPTVAVMAPLSVIERLGQ